MIDKLKIYGGIIAAIFLAVGAYFYGAQVAKTKAEKQIAELERDYAKRKIDALDQAERIRKEQESEFLAKIAELNRVNIERTADVERVRKQFADRGAGSNTSIISCNSRAGRCEHLLAEAYSLAGECERLLKDRDARLSALK